MYKRFLSIGIVSLAILGGAFLTVKVMHDGHGISFAPHAAQASVAAPVVQLTPGSYKKPVVPTIPETYSVSQGQNVWPKIIQATVNPPGVHVGDVQHLNVVIEDDSQVTNVLAIIQTDHGTTTIPLKLDGPVAINKLVTPKYGVDANNQLVLLDGNNSLVSVADAALQKLSYSADWTVKDTHDTFYKTTFFVEDASNRQNTITLDWSDACGIPNSGGLTLSSNCVISSLDGVQGGNLTIATGTTLTLNSEFAITQGNSFTINGSVVIGAGGSIKFETLYMTDADGDGYPAATTVYNATAAGRVTRASVAHPTSPDCNDASAGVYQNLTGYQDSDGDGYTSGGPYAICSGASLPGGYISFSNGTDCNDGNGYVFQTMTTATDSDHDGYTTGGAGSTCVGPGLVYNGRSYYRDTSGGYTQLPSGSILGTSDCNDSNSLTYQNLSGYVDGDGDGYGAGSLTSVCSGGSLPSGYVNNNTDCDDTHSSVWHNISNVYYDADGDGYYGINSLFVGPYCVGAGGPNYRDVAGNPWDTVGNGPDCNDSNGSLYQYLPEYRDADGDGYGAGGAVSKCSGASLSPDSGYVANNTDCYDSNSAAHPGGSGYHSTDRGDGSFDYNCDGSQTPLYVISGSCTAVADSYCTSCAPGYCQYVSGGWYGGTPACGQTGLKLGVIDGNGNYGCSACNVSAYVVQQCY